MFTSVIRSFPFDLQTHQTYLTLISVALKPKQTYFSERIEDFDSAQGENQPTILLEVKYTWKRNPQLALSSCPPRLQPTCEKVESGG